MIPVLDTNILIDHLANIPQAMAEVAKYDDAIISSVTWAEVMVGSRPSEERQTREFLNTFEVRAFDIEIAEIAWRLRRKYRMRLPDAAIWATAKHAGTQLITRNTRDFSDSEADILVPYRL